MSLGSLLKAGAGGLTTAASVANPYIAALAALGGVGKLGYDAYRSYNPKQGPQNPTAADNLLYGQNEGYNNVPIRTPEQIADQNQIRQHALSQLTGGDFGFQGIEDVANKKFHSQYLPLIKNQLAGMGLNESSSAYQNAILGGYGDLQNNLNALRSQHNLQREQTLSNLLGQGMQQNFSPQFTEGNPGLLGNLGQYISQPDNLRAAWNYFNQNNQQSKQNSPAQQVQALQSPDLMNSVNQATQGYNQNDLSKAYSLYPGLKGL